VTVGWT